MPTLLSTAGKATTRNLAHIGQLYLNGGRYNGRRIVSRGWIERSTHANIDNEAYSYGWNNIMTQEDGKLTVTPRFFALGLFGQVLFCDPEQNLIFVTLGEKKGYSMTSATSFPALSNRHRLTSDGLSTWSNQGAKQAATDYSPPCSADHVAIAAAET